MKIIQKNYVPFKIPHLYIFRRFYCGCYALIFVGFPVLKQLVFCVREYGNRNHILKQVVCRSMLVFVISIRYTKFLLACLIQTNKQTYKHTNKQTNILSMNDRISQKSKFAHTHKRIITSFAREKLLKTTKLHFIYMVINLFSSRFLLCNWFCLNRDLRGKVAWSWPPNK